MRRNGDMYASMEEILNAVAAGELTPEEADREIEALQALSLIHI